MLPGSAAHLGQAQLVSDYQTFFFLQARKNCHSPESLLESSEIKQAAD